MRWPRLHVNRRSIALGVVILALFALAHSHFRFALVLGDSMRPGWRTGDLLLVDKRAYRNAEPQRGEIVLARYGKEYIVKRIVGLPGERVELRRDRLYVNGMAVAEPYSMGMGILDISAGRLLSGKFALLGDNRSMSISQNVHAIIPKSDLVGKVVYTLHR